MTVSEATLSAILRTYYGITTDQVRALPGEVDQNSDVTATDGRRYVVKVSRAGEGEHRVSWQNQLLMHLDRDADHDALPLPRVVHTLDGAGHVVLPPGYGDHTAPDDADDPADADGRVVRVSTWLPGVMLADLPHHSDVLLREVGRTAGRLTRALATLPPVAHVPSTHHWDLLRAPAAVETSLPFVPDPDCRADVTTIMSWFDTAVLPVVDALPRGAVHQDLNDFNLLVDRDVTGAYRLSGVLDFSDALHTARVCEVAIAAAYAMLRKADPLRAAASVLAGYHEVAPLSDIEVAVVFPLAAARLCVNATTWTMRAQLAQESGAAPDPYGESRMSHTWPVIARLARTAPSFAESVLRLASGLRPASRAKDVCDWIAEGARHIAPVLLPPARLVDVDLSIRSEALDCLGSLQDAGTGLVLGEHQARGSVPAGRHLEARASRLTRCRDAAGEPATARLGLDLFLAPGTVVCTPLAGVVEPPHPHLRPLRINAAAVVLRHEPPACPVFWTRWTGLDAEVLADAAIPAGHPLGMASASADDEGVAGRVTVQVLTSVDQLNADVPTYVQAWTRTAWAAVCPDPAPLMGVDRDGSAPFTWDVGRVTTVREKHFAPSQRSYYREPMNLVRGDGVWLYDENALGYLDAVNNVTHVGHSNAAVATAASRQMRRLNTNSRFVYDGIARYAEQLTKRLPEQLEVVFLVCSGSEANDLAMRIARQVTGREHVLVIDGAYHGNTSAVTGISPNRYKGPGGSGAPPTTHEVQQPDRYRGPHGYDDPAAGARYGALVTERAEAMRIDEIAPAAFFAESLMGTAGIVLLPDGYLQRAFAGVRAAGGLCVSDEVQVGFGRLGTDFWGFQAQGVVPDIVTMGKPMGNGHPMAAVVTTREIATAFDSGMKYFNTFGGNPVSCEIGLAVLDEIDRQSLQPRALRTGEVFLSELGMLQEAHSLIGDVRGQGLYLGVELVRDRVTKEPATREAYRISERMKDEGIIVYPTGTFDNVLKIKPPMVFDETHVALFVETLDGILSETA